MLYLMRWHLAVLLIAGACSQGECRADTKDTLEGQFFGCDKKNMKEIDFFNTPFYHTNISLLENQNGKRFIVKQASRDSLYLRLSTVRDTLAADIAESAGVPANRVKIIAGGCNFSGKRILETPATLHEVVPGVKIKDLPKDSPWRYVFIHQFIKSNKPQSEWGLTMKVVQSMALNPDLCKIAALDTFIANIDRNGNNFFCDEESSQFFAIDLEHSFKHNLALCACRFIVSLINDKENVLSAKELQALHAYKDILHVLIKLNTPKSLYKKKINLIDKAGIQLSSKVIKIVKNYKQVIAENYASCQELVVLLDQLFTKYSTML